jgi:hypothetical protein
MSGVPPLAPVAAAVAVRPIADAREDGTARQAQFAASPLLPQFSETGMLIDRVLQFAQANPLPQRLSSGALLPAPAPGTAVQAPDLAAAISEGLEKSGLFYEAHLAQWLSGARALKSVLAEPQALFARLAEEAGGDSAKSAVTLLQVAPEDAAQAAWLVSLQLDALEHRRAAWQGELWPGQPLRWEIRDAPPHDSGSSDAQQGALRGWQSTITLSLPKLGALHATLCLHTNQQLRIVLHPADTATAALLKAEGVSLASALDAAGTPLDCLIVQPGEAA